MNILNVGNIITNIYVYPCSGGYVMVDTGYAHSLKAVEAKLNKKGIKLSDIKYVFLTHAHGRPFAISDLAKFKKHISGLRLYKLN